MGRPDISPDASGVLRILKSPHVKVDLQPLTWLTGIVIEDSPHVQLFNAVPLQVPIVWDAKTAAPEPPVADRWAYQRQQRQAWEQRLATSTNADLLAAQGTQWLLDQLGAYGVAWVDAATFSDRELATMLCGFRLSRVTRQP